MNKLFILFTLLTSFNLNAQTVLLNENFGVTQTETECNNTNWLNSQNVTYISSPVSPLISPYQTSRGYLNASGKANLLFTNYDDGFIQFKNINTADYVNLSLTMAVLKTSPESNGSELILEMGDESKMKQFKIKLPSGSGTQNSYHLVSIDDDIPSSKNFSIRIRYSSSTSKCKFRIDDLKLTGCMIPPAPIINNPSPSCLFKVMDMPSSTFIQTTSKGTELSPINIVLESGTYYARTVSTVFGCSDVWSKATPVFIKVDTIPAIIKQPKNSITVFDPNYTYTLIAKANTPYIWEVSKDNGLSWNDLEIKEPFSFNEDTLFMKFNNMDYKPYNGYQFRISAYNGGCKTYSNHGTLIVGTELPIKLISLYGDRFFYLNSIGFTTSEEQGTDKYDIERSIDNTKWERIGSLEAMENSSVNVTYTFYDNFPVNGINYYRLKMYTLNGNFVYSPTITVQNNDDIKDKRYYDLSGLEATTLKPNTYYIESINGVAKRIVMAK
jgi:hypothetical protein